MDGNIGEIGKLQILGLCNMNHEVILPAKGHVYATIPALVSWYFSKTADNVIWDIDVDNKQDPIGFKRLYFGECGGYILIKLIHSLWWFTRTFHHFH